VKFTSGVDEDSGNESWAFSNFQVYPGDSCQTVRIQYCFNCDFLVVYFVYFLLLFVVRSIYFIENIGY